MTPEDNLDAIRQELKIISRYVQSIFWMLAITIIGYCLIGILNIPQ